MKLSLRALISAKQGDVFPDPALSGLRYRVRKHGIFAEQRYKGADGKWRAAPLDKVDVDARLAELSAAIDPEIDRPFQADLADILEPVREKARELRRAIAKGHNPRGDQGTIAADSLKARAEAWLAAKGDQWSPRTLPERRRHLMRDWSPFHARPLATLKWPELQAHLEKLKRRELRDDKDRPYGGPIAANRSRSTLYALCKWAKVSPNPVELVDRAVKERSRERVLSPGRTARDLGRCRRR